MADSRAVNGSDKYELAGNAPSVGADAAATAAAAAGPGRRLSSCSDVAARSIRTVIVIFTEVVVFTDVFVVVGGVSVDVRRSQSRPKGGRPRQSIAAAAASRQPSRGRPSRSCCCSAFGGARVELACRDTPTGDICTV